MTAVSKDAGIFQIRQVAGCFGLGEFEYFFKVRNAHFLVFKDQMQDPEAGFIGAGFENLRTQ
jgi:hypothetical protein